MRKRLMKGTAYALCAALTMTSLPTLEVLANNGLLSGDPILAQVGTPSQAERDTEPETIVDDLELEFPELPELPEIPDKATSSQANKPPVDIVVQPSLVPVKKVALTATSSLGDIWDPWSGKTSFEFLSGNQGEGTEEKPYLIKNREQFMGLSELTAMGMLVPEAEGAKYAGDYSGCYFALGENIDLQGVNWIPIGFYRDSSENVGEVPNPFSGYFDGNGKTIKKLKTKFLCRL